MPPSKAPYGQARTWSLLPQCAAALIQDGPALPQTTREHRPMCTKTFPLCHRSKALRTRPTGCTCAPRRPSRHGLQRVPRSAPCQGLENLGAHPTRRMQYGLCYPAYPRRLVCSATQPEPRVRRSVITSPPRPRSTRRCRMPISPPRPSMPPRLSRLSSLRAQKLPSVLPSMMLPLPPPRTTPWPRSCCAVRPMVYPKTLQLHSWAAKAPSAPVYARRSPLYSTGAMLVF